MLLPSQKWRLHILAISMGSIRSVSIVKLGGYVHQKQSVIFFVIIEISGSALPNLGVRSEYLHG